MPDVLCAGVVVVDHLAAPIPEMPAAGQLALTEDCFLAIGGCASNVAVDLAKQRISVGVAGLVGADPFGDFARRILSDAGVEVGQLQTTAAAATSQTLIINVRGQDRRFIHYIGANQHLNGKSLAGLDWKEAKVLYVGGFLLMGLTGDDLADLFQAARARGIMTVLDVVTPQGNADNLKKLAPALQFTDVFLPNADEGLLITGMQSPVEQARFLCDLGAGAVVITEGGGGCVYFSRNEQFRASAFPMDFLDGTGGGDAFDAGFIRGLLEGAQPRRCVELGAALGASCVRATGATTGVFTLEEADQFLAQHQLTFSNLD